VKGKRSFLGNREKKTQRSLLKGCTGTRAEEASCELSANVKAYVENGMGTRQLGAKIEKPVQPGQARVRSREKCRRRRECQWDKPCQLF